MQEVGDVLVGELGRRERKKLETRRALASAALRLAAEKGPDQVTIEEIADAADVSVRTFFNYFSSKEEAIVGRDAEGRAVMVQHLLDRPADEEPFEAVSNVIRAWFEAADTWADERALRHQLVRQHPSLLPRHLAAHYDLERALLTGLAQRMGVEPDDQLYPALVVTASVNAMRLALTWWELKGRAVPLPGLLDEAFASLGDGLTPPVKKKKKRP
jgi:AcrR family transcriptional regulator